MPDSMPGEGATGEGATDEDGGPPPWERAWRRLSAGDRWVYGGAAALALLALLGRPLLAWNDPSLPVIEAYRAGGPDPWGRPFRKLEVRWEGNPIPWVAASAGPDGELDTDDDLLVPARRPGPPGIHEVYAALAVAPWILAALLAGGWELVRFLSRPRHADLRVELALAAALALPLGAAGAWVSLALLREGGPEVRALVAQVSEALFVPFEAALFGTCAGVSFLLLLGLRARQEPAEGEGSGRGATAGQAR